jgi:hypothetical protein
MKKSYSWPKKAVVIYVPAIDREGKMANLEVIDPLFKNIEEATGYINLLNNNCSAVVVLEVKLVRKWLLRRGKFQKPGFTYTARMRGDSFMRLLSQNRQYVILATPGPGNGQTTPVTAGAFRRGIDKDIDLFLQVADWPVAPDANSAAIYETRRIFGWDMENHQELPGENMESEEKVIFCWKKV